jgi:hypothetical protein
MSLAKSQATQAQHFSSYPNATEALVAQVPDARIAYLSASIILSVNHHHGKI